MNALNLNLDFKHIVIIQLYKDKTMCYITIYTYIYLYNYELYM